jgi:hypothetical protein
LMMVAWETWQYLAACPVVRGSLLDIYHFLSSPI